MAIERTEALDGMGEVYAKNGSKICRARYRLHTWQAQLDGGSGGSLPDVQDVRGHLTLSYQQAARVMSHRALQLRLEDGRWLDIAIASSEGAITGLGGVRATRT